MKIQDKNNELIATVIFFKDLKNGRNFITDDDQEFQAGTFVYEKNTKANRHVHKKDQPKTYFTSEAIVVFSGQRELKFMMMKEIFLMK